MPIMHGPVKAIQTEFFNVIDLQSWKSQFVWTTCQRITKIGQSIKKFSVDQILSGLFTLQ